ncbi:PAS domain-containing sensor histidine kinase [Frigidibacter sp. SD6-1]|uniref:PAS domain-containing sensor histidine kinase n=1 Tax=Frigidibacter sp. SD6-1 TaxID=3032581 RepID=UPI0024E031C7|nr:PAS domain-containing sensor histidine kinase [Frigidibacter sp. SD6-1]
MPELARKYSLTWMVTPDLLGILSESGRFENTNPAWLKTLGYTAEEVENRLFFELLHPDDVERSGRAFELVKAGRPILNFENRYRHKDGTYRWLSWNAVPEDHRFFCSARDITEHKQNAAALLASEEAARLREQFIAVLGHDLRNPLAAISAATRMMRREAQGEKMLHLLDVTQGSVDRMAKLISDVMDFARARLGKGLSVNRRTSVPLKPALEQAISEIGLAQPSVAIEVMLDFAEGLNADPGRIAQLLSNLLANAISHGDGTRAIRVRAVDRDGKFVMTVANSGPSIAPAAMDDLFQPFFRANIDNNQQGLGLGLYISAEIARAHGGTLTVTSEGDDTIFSFEMPRA